MGFADRITPLGKHPTIASLSLGATRTFRLKRAVAETDAGQACAGGQQRSQPTQQLRGYVPCASFVPGLHAAQEMS